LPWGWNTGEFGPREHPEDPEESALHNTAVEPICRKYLDLRYRLLAYNYTLCREAHESGMPLMRALWLHYPEDSQAARRSDEYLWGRDILVAPVTERVAKERRVYLPPGEWYDFWTNEQHAGGRDIVRAVDLETLPLFVRAGAILPLDPVRQFTSEETNKPLTARVYAGADGTARWYEDDGASLNYRNGAFAWSDLAWDDSQQVLMIRREGSGDFAPPKRQVTIELMPSGERQTVTLDSEAVDVKF
jgi:alpha-glucosidase/alpha-D-xyloside xylohydrolase